VAILNSRLLSDPKERCGAEDSVKWQHNQSVLVARWASLTQKMFRNFKASRLLVAFVVLLALALGE
jgi:hypothetical protein